MVFPTYPQSNYRTQEYQTNSPNFRSTYSHSSVETPYPKVQTLAMKLDNFIHKCDSILSDLGSAKTTEFFDSMTSNQSLLGSFISSASYHQNHQVVKRLDGLKKYAKEINSDLKKFKKQGIPLDKLSTHLSGKKIRMAENAEHNFLADLFTSSTFSSISSINTLRELSSRQEKLHKARNQAIHNLTILKNYIH